MSDFGDTRLNAANTWIVDSDEKRTMARDALRWHLSITDDKIDQMNALLTHDAAEAFLQFAMVYGNEMNVAEEHAESASTFGAPAILNSIPLAVVTRHFVRTMRQRSEKEKREAVSSEASTASVGWFNFPDDNSVGKNKIDTYLNSVLEGFDLKRALHLPFDLNGDLTSAAAEEIDKHCAIISEMYEWYNHATLKEAFKWVSAVARADNAISAGGVSHLFKDEWAAMYNRQSTDFVYLLRAYLITQKERGIMHAPHDACERFRRCYRDKKMADGSMYFLHHLLNTLDLCGFQDSLTEFGIDKDVMHILYAGFGHPCFPRRGFDTVLQRVSAGMKICILKPVDSVFNGCDIMLKVVDTYFVHEDLRPLVAGEVVYVMAAYLATDNFFVAPLDTLAKSEIVRTTHNYSDGAETVVEVLKKSDIPMKYNVCGHFALVDGCLVEYASIEQALRVPTRFGAFRARTFVHNDSPLWSLGHPTNTVFWFIAALAYTFLRSEKGRKPDSANFCSATAFDMSKTNLFSEGAWGNTRQQTQEGFYFSILPAWEMLTVRSEEEPYDIVYEMIRNLAYHRHVTSTSSSEFVDVMRDPSDAIVDSVVLVDGTRVGVIEKVTNEPPSLRIRFTSNEIEDITDKTRLLLVGIPNHRTKKPVTYTVPALSLGAIPGHSDHAPRAPDMSHRNYPRERHQTPRESHSAHGQSQQTSREQYLHEDDADSVTFMSDTETNVSDTEDVSPVLEWQGSAETTSGSSYVARVSYDPHTWSTYHYKNRRGEGDLWWKHEGDAHLRIVMKWSEHVKDRVWKGEGKLFTLDGRKMRNRNNTETIFLDPAKVWQRIVYSDTILWIRREGGVLHRVLDWKPLVSAQPDIFSIGARV